MAEVGRLFVGLRQALRGRRGILCRVVQAGLIRRGDGIEVLGGVVAEDQSQEL